MDKKVTITIAIDDDCFKAFYQLASRKYRSAMNDHIPDDGDDRGEPGTGMLPAPYEMGREAPKSLCEVCGEGSIHGCIGVDTGGPDPEPTMVCHACYEAASKHSAERPTPRTDAIQSNGIHQVTDAFDHAREFERELAEAKELLAQNDASRGLFTSTFRIGDAVMLSVGDNQRIPGYVRAVTFTSSKVRYAIYSAVLNTTFHNIDSFFVELPSEPTPRIIMPEDNFS